MQFRRIDDLPPYVFAQVNELKLEARRAGEDIIDLGFGNPDIPSREFVVDKLVEAARKPQNHRYSPSRVSQICERPSPTAIRGASVSRSTPKLR